MVVKICTAMQTESLPQPHHAEQLFFCFSFFSFTLIRVGLHTHTYARLTFSAEEVIKKKFTRNKEFN